MALRRLKALEDHLRGVVGAADGCFASNPDGSGSAAAGCGGGLSADGAAGSISSKEAPADLTVSTMSMERARASFNSREMTYLLDGSPEVTRMREEIMKELEDDPVLNAVDAPDLSRPDARRRTMDKITAAWRMFASDSGDVDRRMARVQLLMLYEPSWATRNGVHFGLFMGAITGMGDQEQQNEWLPPTMMMTIFGCFGLTELGHGSFVRGIETTATFIRGAGDDGDGEFEIHSPTVTATKWWIGGAGQTATHCAAYARLLVDGVDHGVNCFIVPIRNVETHDPMPGVEVGDIGAKFGRNGLDNGWIRFNRVRVPRKHMLMKHSQVSREGVFSASERAAAAYGVLISGRAGMVQDSADNLKRAITIAVRYAAVRRQGQPFDEAVDTREPQLLDYKTVQSRLMPMLATAYAFHFTAAHMTTLYKMWLEKDAEGSSDAEFEGMLKDVHATSAGLKAFCTWNTHESIDICRQTCGGHGYSSYNVLSSMFADFAVMCTWEGDNTVMALQTARYLMSSCLASQKGEQVAGSVSYLVDSIPSHCSAVSPEGLVDFKEQLNAMRFLSKSLTVTAHSKLRLREKDFPDRIAWNDCSVQLLACSRAHVYTTILSCFVTAVESADETLSKPLGTMCSLFGLHTISSHLGSLLEHGYFSPEQASWVDDLVVSLNERVRADAVALVDAFNYTDFIIQAPIGRREGDIYEPYFNRVKAAPHGVGPTPYFQEKIAPMLRGEHMT